MKIDDFFMYPENISMDLSFDGRLIEYFEEEVWEEIFVFRQDSKK